MPKRTDGSSHTTSWTEISTFRQCPHKHKLQYFDRWKAPKLNKPLSIGILWHEILDCHYSGVRNTGDVTDPGKGALLQIVELLNANDAKNPDGKAHEIGATCLRMYNGYREWAKQVDLGWTIREVEVEFEVQLPNSEIVLVGRIDLVIEFRGHLWVIDHKAVRNLPNGKELDLDDQTPLYIWAMRQFGYPVRGAILSHTRTQQLKRPMAPEERYSRDWIYRTSEEINTVVREATASINMAYHPEQAHERHPDPQMCKWRCPYLEPCIGGRKEPHLEVELLKGLGFTRPQPKLQIVET